MKNIGILFIVLCFLLFCASAHAQGTGTTIRYGPTLPATCVANTGQQFSLTSGTKGMYECKTTNTWTIITPAPCTSTVGGAVPTPPNDVTQVLNGQCQFVKQSIQPGLGNIYSNPLCAGQTNCYTAAWDVQYALSASWTSGNTTITTGSSDPVFCDGGTFPCSAYMQSIGHTTDVGGGIIAFGTSGCSIGNPDQCNASVPQTTITAVTGPHTATVANAPTTNGVSNGSVAAYFAWGHNDQTALKTAYNAMDNNHTSLQLPCGATFFNADLFVGGTALAQPRSFVGCPNNGTVMIPLPNFTCLSVRACFAYDDFFGGQVLSTVGFVAGIQNIEFWGLGLDVNPGGSTYANSAVAGVTVGSFHQCQNTFVIGWLWNVTSAFRIYGFDSRGGVSQQCGSYVGGNFSCRLNGQNTIPTVFIGGWCGSSANDGITVDGTDTVDIIGTSIFPGVSGTPYGLKQSGGIVNLSGTEGGPIDVTAGTLNIMGGSVNRQANNNALTISGGLVNATGVSFLGAGTNWLNISAGTFRDGCGNTFANTATITQSGGLYTGSCSISTTVQTAGNWSTPAGAGAGQWGTSPSTACPGTLETSAGTSTFEACTITVGSGTVGSNPILTITWPTVFQAAPNCSAKMTGGTATLANFTTGTVSTTTGAFTYQGTPGASTTIGLQVTCGNG